MSLQFNLKYCEGNMMPNETWRNGGYVKLKFNEKDD